MITALLILLGWFALGFLGLIIIWLHERNEVLVNDVLFCCGFGVLTLIAGLLHVMSEKLCRVGSRWNKLMNKRLW